MHFLLGYWSRVVQLWQVFSQASTIRALVMIVLMLPMKMAIGSEASEVQDSDPEAVIRWELSPVVDAIVAPYRDRLEKSPDRIEAGLKELLATEGYFNPAIRMEALHPAALKGRTVVVREGHQARVRTIDLQVKGATDDEVAAWRLAWSLPVNAIFRDSQWVQAKESILQSLLSRRYLSAQFEFTAALVDDDHAQVDLQIRINAGPVHRYGQVQVVGLHHYSERIVREYIKALAYGEPVQASTIFETQQALQALPYFSRIELKLLDPVESPTGNGLIRDLRIDVVEAALDRYGFGIGLYSDTGLRLEASHHTPNFLSQAIVVDSNLSVDQYRQRAFADFYWPAQKVLKPLGLGLIVERSDIQGLQTHRLSIGLRWDQQRGRVQEQFGLTWTGEIRRVGASTSTQDGAVADAISPGSSVFSKAFVPNARWTIRALDHPTDPSKGWVHQLQAGAGLQRLASDRSFLSLHLRSMAWYPLDTKHQLRFRSEMGSVIAASKQGVPETYLFRTGGTNSLRGFAFQALGIQEAGAVVGAKHMALVSLDWTYWFKPSWGLALFSDAASVFDRLEDVQVRRSIGVGGRWRGPLGPVQIDIAKAAGQSAPRLHFSLSIPI